MSCSNRFITLLTLLLNLKNKPNYNLIDACGRTVQLFTDGTKRCCSQALADGEAGGKKEDSEETKVLKTEVKNVTEQLQRTTDGED